MSDIKKPEFNADAAEEYFSNLLTFYRKTANDIFKRDNEGRNSSNYTYSAEYQKWLGMQIAMREVLEYFGKYDLHEWGNEIPSDRLRELVEADRAGRIKVLPEATGQVCGTCANFQRKPGGKSGTCKVRKYYTDRRGNEDHMRGEFTPSQSRQACRQYKSAEPESLAAVLKDRFFCRRNYCCTKECSKCCDYGECVSCALCGFPYECQKCERNYTKEQLEKIRSGEANEHGE